MSIVARLPEVLGPIRTSPAQRGVNVTFERGGRWRTMHVIEAPHLELSIEVPELAGHRVHAHLGPETVLGDGEAADDIRWRMKTDTPALAAAIFAEAPWPRREHPLRGASWPGAKRRPLTVRGALKMLGAFLVLGPFGSDAFVADGLPDPVPMYVLDVERGVASIERRDGESDPSRGLGMVRRLVQLATWPDRALAAQRALAARLDGTIDVEAERWAPGANAITIRRTDATVRIDHELTRAALRTRIRVLDADDATAFLDGVVSDAELVGRTIDALVAKVARPAVRGPYR